MELKDQHMGLFQTLINVMNLHHLHSGETNLDIMFAKRIITDINCSLFVCQALCEALYMSDVT